MVLDARTRKVVMSKLNDGRYFYAMRFTPDGRTLLAGVSGPGTEISAQRFAVASGRPIGTPRLITQRHVFVTPMLMHNGTRVITTMPGRTEIRDARTLRTLRRWPVGADVAALGPDDRTVLLGGADGSVRFLDLRNGRRAGRVVLLEDQPNARAILESLAAPVADEPETGALREQLHRLVAATLDALPGHYGEALEWKYVDGLSVREIAARLGVGEKAAESMLSRARESFREAIGAVI